MYYSHSKLEAFRNCPFSYKLQYIDRVRSDRQSIEAFMGSRVHEALEKLYLDLRLTRLLPEDGLVDFYHACWEKNWHEGIFIVKGEYSAEDYRRTGEEALRTYYRRYYPFNQGKSLWLENRVRIPLDQEGRYCMEGVVDRLVDRGEGHYEIHDYKTSGLLPDQGEVDSDPQLALYQLAVEASFSDVQQVDLVWHYLIFDKELKSRRSQEALVELKNSTIALIETIERTEVFEPRESSLCEWCVYPDLCPRQKHLFLVQALPAAQFNADDGVRLANRYRELTERKKETEAELESLKREIAEYCRQLGADQLRGSSTILEVKTSLFPRFPRSGSEERAAMDEQIKQMGRWEEVAALSTQKLSRIIQMKSWPHRELALLEPFVSWEESVIIRQKKAEEIEADPD
jgi:putative RecB family exonuclease